MRRRPPRSTLFPDTTLFRPLTEPDFGSNPAGMRTSARRDGGDWVLNGTKMWITNGGIADLAVVWARTGDERSEEHTSELQSRQYLVCRLLLEKKTKSRMPRS